MCTLAKQYVHSQLYTPLRNLAAIEYWPCLLHGSQTPVRDTIVDSFRNSLVLIPSDYIRTYTFVCLYVTIRAPL
jgi:hypothetical protein